MASWLSDAETRQAAWAAGFQDARDRAALDAVRPLDAFLPMSIIPGAAGSVFETGDLGKVGECNVIMWQRLDRGTLWLLDYEYEASTQVRDNDGNNRIETSTYSGTIAALVDPRIVGDVDLRKDWKSGIGGALLNAFLWVPPFTIVKAFQYGWAPKDLEIGQKEFDARFVVEASSAESAQRAIGPALGQCLLDIEFKERLRIRPGVALVRLPSNRQKGREGFTKEMQRLHAIVTAILAGAAAPAYR